MNEAEVLKSSVDPEKILKTLEKHYDHLKSQPQNLSHKKVDELLRPLLPQVEADAVKLFMVYAYSEEFDKLNLNFITQEIEFVKMNEDSKVKESGDYEEEFEQDDEEI